MNRFGREPTAFRVLSTRPPVVYILHWLNVDVFERLRPLSEAIAGDPAYFLVRWCWNLLGSGMLERVVAEDAAYRRDFPSHALVHLTPTEEETELLQRAGVRAVFCNTNCLLDERVFVPLDRTRRFDAVYDARLLPYKRHELAVRVPRLALVYASDHMGQSDVTRIRALLPSAHFVNHEGGTYRSLRPNEVNEVLNESHVGLCLSAEEGPMYAATQYLLSGLMVVTTPSTGGRATFFDDRDVVEVAPDPTSVRDAVLELSGSRMDPAATRERVLERIRAHRAVFVAVVEEACAEAGYPRRFTPEFTALFSNELITWQPVEEGIAHFTAAREQ